MIFEKLTFYDIQLELDINERVFTYIVISKGNSDNLLKIFKVFGR